MAETFTGTDAIRFVMRQDISARNLSYRGRKLARMVSLYLDGKNRPMVIDYYMGVDGRVAYVGF